MELLAPYAGIFILDLVRISNLDAEVFPQGELGLPLRNL
jgi:hypothetical protein